MKNIVESLVALGGGLSVYNKKEGCQMTVDQFKLACISNEELTDAEVSILMKNVLLGSEEDVIEFCEILHKYRLELEKEFIASSKNK